MNLSEQQLIRIADDIRDQLMILRANRYSRVIGTLANFLEQVEILRSIRRKLELCHGRSWESTSTRLVGNISSCLRNVPYCLQQLERALAECRMDLPSPAEVYAELLQAEQEFGQLRYCQEGSTVSVVTDPIELEGVYLGSFEIQLHVPGLAEVNGIVPYRIVALDPNPAATNDAVTHPHVSDEYLCAGDAAASIRTALNEGRICDCLLLIRSILTTYNPSSPYVSLEDWHGRACYECGCVVNEDDLYLCGICERDFCPECSSYCRRCEASACVGCLEACGICDEPICPSCMMTCPDCGQRLCRSCLEEGRCGCLDDQQENDKDEQERVDNRTPSVAGGTEGTATARSVGINPA